MTAGYTGEGLRAWKQTSSGKTYFLYDGLTPVCELNSSGTVTACNTFGAAGLLARHTSSHVFYTFDPTGNVCQRLNASGSVLGSYVFDSFGNRVSTDNSTDPYSGYGSQSGYYTDWETGLALLGHRYYDPATGRFLTRDPMGYAGGINLYGYVWNNPLNLGDPTGFGFDPIGWYMGGMGGFSPWVDNHLMGGSTANFGDAAGRYDSGCASLGDVAAAGAIWGANLLNNALLAKDMARLGWELGEGGFSMLRGGCFVAGTPVIVQADTSGQTTSKPIEQIKQGDLVASRNPQTGKTEFKKVEAAKARHVPTVLTLHLADAKTAQEVESITCTPEHPFFVQGQGFTPAGRLAIGNAIVTRAGPDLIVKWVEWQQRKEGYTVYNFTVEEDHTYFVGLSGGGAWVHNICTLNPGDNLGDLMQGSPYQPTQDTVDFNTINSRAQAMADGTYTWKPIEVDPATGAIVDGHHDIIAAQAAGVEIPPGTVVPADPGWDPNVQPLTPGGWGAVQHAPQAP